MAKKEKKIPVVKEIKEVKVKKDKKLKPPKPNKKNLVKTLIGAIPAAYTKFKKSKEKFKTNEQKFVKQEKDTITDLKNQASIATKGADDTYNALSDAQKKIYNAGTSKGMSKAKILAYIAGGGTIAGLAKFGYDVNQEMKKMAVGGSALKSVPSNNTGLAKLPTPVRNKMGYMKKGGMAKKRAKSSSKKSRGTGAAIKGTKFKGVF